MLTPLQAVTAIHVIEIPVHQVDQQVALDQGDLWGMRPCCKVYSIKPSESTPRRCNRPPHVAGRVSRRRAMP